MVPGNFSLSYLCFLIVAPWFSGSRDGIVLHHVTWTNTHHSRQALKKYVKANNAISVSDNMFDSLFNKALKAGVDKGVFEQPKGKPPVFLRASR